MFPLSTTSYSILLVHKIVIYAGVNLKIIDGLVPSDDVHTFLKGLGVYSVLSIALPVAFLCGLVLSVFVEQPFRALMI